jgi:hypothetical protein
VTRGLSQASRILLCAVIFLIVQAVLRWQPVHAASLSDLRAAPLGALAVALAVLAALRPRPERVAPPVRPLLVGLAITSSLLALVVWLRPAAGLTGRASAAWGAIGEVAPGPIDVVASDLQDLAGGRRWTIEWEGELRAPESGAYRFWAAGRGQVDVFVDGRRALAGEGDPLSAGGDLTLSAGPHVVAIRLQRVGGPRLRLGWTRPGRDGRPTGRDEVIPPRHLGPVLASAWWGLTDVLSFLTALLAAALVWRLPWDAPRPLPVPRPLTLTEISISAAAHALVLAVMSWPLVSGLSTLGVMDRPDGRLNAWILAWDAHALVRDPARLFQAPAFHPLPDALAFSENLLLPAVLAAPGLLVGGPTLGYNLALLLSLLVSGLGVQLLVRRVSGDRLAAFAAGVFFAAGAHRWIRLAHLHAQVTLFLPFVLLALDRFAARRTLRRALLVGALLALQGLSSIYLGAVTASMIVAVLVVGLAGGWRAPDVLRLLGGLGLAALVVAPVLFPYLRMREFQGTEWTLEDVATYATTLTSYAASGTRLYGGLTQRHLPPAEVQDTLFPGLVLLVLGLCGLARAPRRYVAVAVVASALAVVVSLGPETAFYRFLHEHVVLVRGVRALSRFSLAPVLCLSVLAGIALSGRWRLAVPAVLLFALESSNVPIRYATSPSPSAAARWLRGQEGPVAVLPLGERDTEVMLEGTVHWRPLVNGDSGFVPRPYNRVMESLELPLSQDALRLLRGLGVRHVVSREDLPLLLLTQLGEERVYAVPPGESARPVLGTPDVPVLWTRQGAVLDTGEARMVEGVAFELSDAPYVEHPTVEVSLDGREWRTVQAVSSLADATLSLVSDPRHGLAELRLLPPSEARFVRLPGELPFRFGAAVVRPSPPGQKGRK